MLSTTASLAVYLVPILLHINAITSSHERQNWLTLDAFVTSNSDIESRQKLKSPRWLFSHAHVRRLSMNVEASNSVDSPIQSSFVTRTYTGTCIVGMHMSCFCHYSSLPCTIDFDWTVILFKRGRSNACSNGQSLSSGQWYREQRPIRLPQFLETSWWYSPKDTCYVCAQSLKLIIQKSIM